MSFRTTHPKQAAVKNPLGVLVATSLENDDAYYDLWHVENGALNYPIWNYLVDRAINEPTKYDVDEFAGFMLTVKKFFQYLKKEKSSDVDALESQLEGIEGSRFRHYQPLRADIIKAIKKDIDDGVSENEILQKIVDASSQYFSDEFKKDNKYFALYVLIILETVSSGYIKDRQKLVRNIIDAYRKKILENEQKVFTLSRDVWLQDDTKDTIYKYTVQRRNNILFLLQNAYMYNPDIRMPKTTTLFKDNKNVTEFENKAYATVAEFFEDSLGYKAFVEDFKSIEVVNAELSHNQADIAKMPLLFFEVPDYEPIQKKSAENLKDNTQVKVAGNAILEAALAVVEAKEPEPTIFQRIRNSYNKFAEKYPRLTLILIAMVVLTVIAALVIGITIATGGAGAIAGVAVLGLAAAHLPGAAAALAGAVAISATVAALIDTAIVVGAAGVVWLAATVGVLIKNVFAKKEVPSNIEQKISASFDSEASADADTDTSSSSQDNKRKNDLSKGEKSVKDIFVEPETNDQNRPRVKLSGNLSPLREESMFHSSAKEVEKDVPENEVKKDEGFKKK